jgi:hypothetical protein
MTCTGFYRRCTSKWIEGIVVLVALGSAVAAQAADRIVLRNLKILTDRTVSGLDEDGVRLDDGSVLGWDEVEKGKVADSQQADFDRYLTEVGEPLYRIRQRLSVGDYRGLLPHAEAIYARYADRDSPAAYMVAQALMWARLASGRREESLDPYLRCLEYVRRHPGAENALPGQRHLACDPATGLAKELLPVWFDEQAAGKAIPAAFAAITRMRKPRPDGVNIYFATLALTAGQVDSANRVLSAMTATTPELGNLREIVESQRDMQAGRADQVIQRLSPRWAGYDESSKPVALYWLGKARTRSADVSQRQAGLLDLLRIPAIYGTSQPDLAAAALYRSMQVLSELKDLRGSVAVRKELLEKYPHTSFAERVAPGASSEAAPDSGADKETP